MADKSRWWQRPDVGGIAATVAFFAVMYRDVIFQGRHWLFGDNAFQNFPWHYFVYDRIRHGGLTLPCREMALGFPLYAEPQVQAFYPFNTALWPIGDPFVSFTVKMLLHMLAATIGMYCLARQTGRSALAATAAAVVMSGGSFMVYRVVHAPILFALAWLPWIILLYLKTLKTGSRVASAGLIGCAAMQMLASHPQIPVYTALACLIMGFGTQPLTGESAWRHRGRIVGFIFGAYAAGLLLAMVQMAPTYELYLYGSRTRGADVGLIRQWGSSLSDLALNVLGRAEGQYKWEKVAFPGSLAWVAVFFGLLNWRDRSSRPLLALVALGLLLSWSDTNPLYDVFAYLPVINRLRASGRIGVLIILGSGLLLAKMLDEAREDRTRRLLWSVAAAFGLFELTALATTGSVGVGALSWQLPALVGAAVVAAVSIIGTPEIPVGLRRRPTGMSGVPTAERRAGMPADPGTPVGARGPSHQKIAAVLVVIAAAELFMFSQGVNKSVTVQEFEQDPGHQLYAAAARHCAETGGAFVRWKDGLPDDISIYYGVAQPRGYTAMAGPNLELMNTLLFGPNPPHTLAAFGVQWVGTDEQTAREQGLEPVERFGKWVLCKSPLPAEQAYFPRTLLPGGLEETAAAIADSAVDARDTVVVASKVIGDQPITTSGGKAQVVEDTPTRVVVKTQTAEPNLLVLTRFWTSKWNVDIDGQQARADTASAMLLCAAIPAGDHTVTFRYDAEMLRPGAVSLLLWLLWMAWLVKEWRGRPTEDPAQE